MGDQKLRDCPFCAELIKEQAIKCPHCRTVLDVHRFLTARSWYRIRRGATALGVAAGLAQASGLPVTLIRLAFVLLTLAGGHGVLLYIILYFLMPPAESVTTAVRCEAPVDDSIG